MGLFITLAELIGRNTWPPAGIKDTWDEIELYAALRSSNDERVRQEAGVAWNQPYMISPVPRMVSRASANLLFGQPPEIAAEGDGDQDALDMILDENDIASELHRAAVIASSEGEVWGRLVVQPDVVDVPVVEFCSRARVIPHFAGRFVRGATFVTEWATGSIERVRMFETYERGLVTTRLYRGSTSVLGREIQLKSFDETKGRQPVVQTGVDDSLVVFIPNSVDNDQTRGFSDYKGLEQRFLGLNETSTIAQANQRLAGKKRAIVDAAYLTGAGNLPAGDDIFIAASRMQGDVTKGAGPLQTIDWNAGHEDTIRWLDHLLDTTLTFSGVSPQSVGRGDMGAAPSGTALKLRMTHSLLEASGKGRYMDRGTRRLLRGAQLLDARVFGRSWSKADAMPSVKRHDGLPRDDVEAAKQVALMYGSESVSVEERVAFLHPDWSEQQRADEVARIREDFQLTTAPVADPQII